MNKLSRFVAILIFPIVSVTLYAGVPPTALEIKVEILKNTPDGAFVLLCNLEFDARPHSFSEWWIEYRKTTNTTACGTGPVKRPRPGVNDSEFPPGVKTAASIRTSLLPNDLIRLKIQLEDASANEGEKLEREFLFARTKEALISLPAVLASGQEDLYVRINAGVETDAEKTLYGIVTVQSGLAGASLLLDGGLVGNIPDKGVITLTNVRVGVRTLCVRDASHDKICKLIDVVSHARTLLALNVPDNTAASERFKLAAIGANSHGYEEYERRIDGAIMVKIPAGEFLMGNHETERTPLEHNVTLSEYLMDKTGVTWKQYFKFAQETNTPLPPDEPYWGTLADHPAAFVTWDEANAYCQWAGARLPTEAEREKAARGLDKRMFPWGSEEPNPELSVNRRSWGQISTDPVGIRPKGASPYGLLDMGGNMWEWCSDWYDVDYYKVSPKQDPKGPPTGIAHVVRGGSWDSRPSVLSASCRSFGHLGYREGDFGFRCAMDSR